MKSKTLVLNDRQLFESRDYVLTNTQALREQAPRRPGVSKFWLQSFAGSNLGSSAALSAKRMSVQDPDRQGMVAIQCGAHSTY